MQAWAMAKNVHLDFIDPDKPMQNAYVETFNGRFRDECLNQHWFRGLIDARVTIARWRHDYNHE
jgi:putative transposase